MKEEKYYTPEISEFYVGFEYEAFHNKEWFFEECGDQWVKSKVSLGTDILTVKYAIDCDFIRVKYLDREDIESCGFKQGKLPYQYFSDLLTIIKLEKENTYSINANIDDHCLFYGTIKNKSELKKLLKQLGIC